MAAIFPDNIFKWICLNENVWISIDISLKFVPRGPINNIPTLVQVMAWRRPGDKPLSETMMVSSPTHIYVTRPQWVKDITHNSSASAMFNLPGINLWSWFCAVPVKWPWTIWENKPHQRKSTYKSGYNRNKTKHNKTICIFYSILMYCIINVNLKYKAHQIPKLKCFLSHLAAVFAQSVEARC